MFLSLAGLAVAIIGLIGLYKNGMKTEDLILTVLVSFIIAILVCGKYT